MSSGVSFRQARRRGRSVPDPTGFVRGAVAWPFFMIGGALLWLAFKLSGESID